MPAISSITSLAGGLRVNYAMALAAYEDPGGKLAALISQVTALQSNLLVLQSAAISANVSAATFSSLSGVTFAVYTTIGNFTST